jgi:uncharacterized protein with HEPN domain
LDKIPWGNIIGLRDKLAHDYGEILAERIWIISKNSVQELLIEIEKIEELKEYINSKRNFAYQDGLRFAAVAARPPFA